ncbi:haloacid dehalogenase type II [Cupriavidus taiwanensis]|uniref:haloacid dehalogenase type II n=1 Tax=Cupriavidus taiwanensis TaxID=164546 RepID=UPI000E10C2B3|nr:haloacid dehalogenase type II [Cupriavidus taiwanensis]SOY43171.1 putative 2-HALOALKANOIC ACID DEHALOGENASE PROTEIN [Cupriavidus taiwanensis]SOY45653.1 putative 2-HALOALKANOIC ACID DEHALOGENASE PROTEIN [Cupriavidus taiwanensis]SOY81098.1 putative 2-HALOALKANOIC ACID DEHALOGENASE PROTEIN [Cupriavidus taiwanensis]SOZ21941.1 putative 2-HALOALKANOIC ACID DEHALOGENASE PROTEIN [Cupriavidus taiwanensis]SOZ53417.1 putative 2-HALOALKANOIC ACID DEHALOGENASE PROTEIN [Cupriavidus taiwanensis]
MNKIRAVVFDAYGTLFDVYSVTARAEQLFPGRGEALALLWRERQIDYTRIRTMAAPDGARYKPFWAITVDALRYAAERLGLPLDEAAEAQLLKEYACLSAFPENLGALKRLRKAGLPLGILSNGNTEMLDISVKSAGMHGLFDHVLSVDAVRQYKTAPAAYALGPLAFGLEAQEMLFVSSNGWDACGATWYGYTTFWINRAGHPAERLDVAPAGAGHDMNDLLEFVRAHGVAA